MLGLLTFTVRYDAKSYFPIKCFYRTVGFLIKVYLISIGLLLQALKFGAQILPSNVPDILSPNLGLIKFGLPNKLLRLWGSFQDGRAPHP